LEFRSQRSQVGSLDQIRPDRVFSGFSADSVRADGRPDEDSRSCPADPEKVTEFPRDETEWGPEWISGELVPWEGKFETLAVE
jgi:hypothetical protein